MARPKKQPRQIPPFDTTHRATIEKPISDVYPVIDTDLARDNVENNLTAADLQDLQKSR